MLDTIKRYLQNALGSKVKDKLIVIESDDWGSIRMPSREVYDFISKKGYKPEKDPYLRYDSLASETDLEALFELLVSFKDREGNSPKITANTICANPDFTKIKNSNFESYEYEPFYKTLQRYPEHNQSFALWKDGIANNIFYPQFHGREHLNVYQWMKGLQSKNPMLHEAFANEMISISSMPTALKYAYMEGLDYFSEEEMGQKSEIIEEGLDLFESFFGYPSTSFIANCYIWSASDEEILARKGVSLIQGISNQYVPVLKNGDHFHRLKRHYYGQKNKYDQHYTIRNVFFEPSLDPNKDWISEAMSRIDIAFKCKKPAIIGSHRLNYIGYIFEENRTRTLELMQVLIKSILKKWPDVKFISTDQLASYSS